MLKISKEIQLFLTESCQLQRASWALKDKKPLPCPRAPLCPQHWPLRTAPVHLHRGGYWLPPGRWVSPLRPNRHISADTGAEEPVRPGNLRVFLQNVSYFQAVAASLCVTKTKGCSAASVDVTSFVCRRSPW